MYNYNEAITIFLHKHYTQEERRRKKEEGTSGGKMEVKLEIPWNPKSGVGNLESGTVQIHPEGGKRCSNQISQCILHPCEFNSEIPIVG